MVAKRRSFVSEAERKAALKETRRRYRERHRERIRPLLRAKQRAYALKRNFGLTVEQYNELLVAQDGRCAICRILPAGTDTYRSAKNLAVDHNHTTGKVRGLLCDNCNRALGQLKDSSNLCIQAALYLLKE